MRKITIVLLVLFVYSDSLRSQTLSTAIAFEERVYNFGTILEKNGKVSHNFVFKNNGKTDVTIADVQSSCGCIGKVITKGPVKPGAKGKVTISFDPSYKSGFFSKEIVVFSNGGNEFNRIWVEGNITPTEHPITDSYPYNFGNGLYLRLKVMAFGYMKPGETRQVELHYANDTNKEMTLSFVAEGNKTGLRFTNPGKIEPKGKGVINVSFTMPAPGDDDVVIRLQPEVNNKKLTQKVEVKVLSERKRLQSTTSKQLN
jgi:hypothetical protein